LETWDSFVQKKKEKKNIATLEISHIIDSLIFDDTAWNDSDKSSKITDKLDFNYLPIEIGFVLSTLNSREPEKKRLT